ncbi:MAG: 30S ribosome-binding factor RbfA [candidate division NC10 bacterium]|nr:30S ribosome-binding factor RbfA [candidate division NC10 bacterium]
MAHPSYKRAERVGDLLREELSLLLFHEVRDPRIGILTITRVTVSDDLRLARVYFSAPTDQEVCRRTLEGLESAAPYLRGELGRRLYLRRIPELLFLADDSLEHGLHIHALLRELKEEREDE